jgi:DNA mismatch repair ATPase MutS
MNHYIIHANPLKTYKEFNQTLIEKVAILQDLKRKLSIISEYKLSFFKVTEIGYVLKQFYEIHSNKVYEDTLLYSFGFNGYIDCLHGIKKNLVEKKIHFVSFTKNKKKNTFKGNYYAALKERNPVKNTVKMNKNMILTGPNASGKTTVLKATLINVILSQQFGCGFYDSGSLLKPYDHLHCYLNIPDTSGRDSLFQAEARRCKEIITSIQETKTESHFCVFDELYSGTNPEEAAVSAISFMNYLVKHKHVSTLLTTHYYNVCETLEKNEQIVNYHMKVDDSSNKNMENIGNFRYTYLLSKGISKVRGGIKVLKDMDYPEEIIESLRNN